MDRPQPAGVLTPPCPPPRRLLWGCKAGPALPGYQAAGTGLALLCTFGAPPDTIRRPQSWACAPGPPALWTQDGQGSTSLFLRKKLDVIGLSLVCSGSQEGQEGCVTAWGQGGHFQWGGQGHGNVPGWTGSWETHPESTGSLGVSGSWAESATSSQCLERAALPMPRSGLETPGGVPGTHSANNWPRPSAEPPHGSWVPQHRGLGAVRGRGVRVQQLPGRSEPHSSRSPSSPWTTR